MYTVIIAGGGGTRLWPLSRTHKPKQLHCLTSDNTMIQDVLERISHLVSFKKIFIVTNKICAKDVKNQIPQIPKNNIIIEPAIKNTAPAIGLAALHIKKVNPKAVMGVFPSDHLITEEEKFLQILKIAEKLVQENDNIVTLGIKPTYPEKGYGYIHLGKQKEEIGGNKIFWVDKFIEKPDYKTATQYVKRWDYLWNSGMFIFKVETILKLYLKYLPKIYKSLMKIEKTLGTRKEREVIEKEYQKMEEISIDYGIMEKAKKVIVVPADIGWSDVGNWSTLKDILSNGTNENIIKGEHLGVDTVDSLIYGSKKLIATVGVSNLIIIETEDAILICPKERAQDVKKIVEKLKEDGKTHLL